MVRANIGNSSGCNGISASGIPAEKCRFAFTTSCQAGPATTPTPPAISNTPFPSGSKRSEGIHSRTDFDLKNHQEYSKRKCGISIRRSIRIIFHMLWRTSVGVDRTVPDGAVHGSLQCRGRPEYGGTNRTAASCLDSAPRLAPVKRLAHPAPDQKDAAGDRPGAIEGL